MDEKRYILSWPNAEVRKSFSRAILGITQVNKIEDEIRDLSKEIQKSIQDLNPSLFSKAIEKVLTKIPFRLFQDNEAIYHSSLLIALWACGFDVWGEDNTNIGIIDISWRYDDYLYIVMEVKYTDKIEKLDQMLKLANKQIDDRKYYAKYLNKKTKVIVMPIAFAKESSTERKELVVKCEMREVC
jgi:hypothetical protein